jgi:hypothetical protein
MVLIIYLLILNICENWFRNLPTEHVASWANKTFIGLVLICLNLINLLGCNFFFNSKFSSNFDLKNMI